jgi:hypothetical protein
MIENGAVASFQPQLNAPFSFDYIIKGIEN